MSSPETAAPEAVVFLVTSGRRAVELDESLAESDVFATSNLVLSRQKEFGTLVYLRQAFLSAFDGRLAARRELAKSAFT